MPGLFWMDRLEEEASQDIFLPKTLWLVAEIFKPTSKNSKLEVYINNYQSMHDGRSINKLQNGIILWILNIWNDRNIHFAANLIVDIYWNSYKVDIIIVTSVLLWTQSVDAIPTSKHVFHAKCYVNKQTCL